MAAQKSYWLVKSEPDVYSIDDLRREEVTMWDGIRNYQARNNMMEMKEGDEVLFYHSRQSPPAVVGVARVSKESYPDPTQFDETSSYHDPKSAEDDPRWHLVDLRFVKKLDRPVPLPEIKERETLSEMVLVRNSRLSVQPVRRTEFETIVRMGSG